MREPDVVWDELDACFGPVRTKAERGRRNVAVKQLKEAGASPAEVRIAYQWCRSNFTVFTEMALVSHFGRAQHEQISDEQKLKQVGDVISIVRRMADGE